MKNQEFFVIYILYLSPVDLLMAISQWYSKQIKCIKVLKVNVQHRVCVCKQLHSLFSPPHYFGLSTLYLPPLWLLQFSNVHQYHKNQPTKPKTSVIWCLSKWKHEQWHHCCSDENVAEISLYSYQTYASTKI